ncbi:CocE/NonD family hydrolase [Rhodococcus tibetensis]|uniref:CocE/NonD family hydrolase n=1 Tax=Rhodococcus tibetensis TaxID=2965064 RepID=A0ABT1Q6P1_9NOCA|nr:CocE/NonD family hydrolase [Rhodococcus sp. FXJ9.536]MCQ4117924.1 CocE/NonD family hydrolase [Rhodococcus sp. FXJ9.536]
MAVGIAVAPTASADPTGGAAAVQWLAAVDAPPAYPVVAIDWDVPITMSDGTVLKANVYRPADAAGKPIDTKMPAVLNVTPYTKLVGNVVDSVLAVPGLEDTVVDLVNTYNLAGTPFDGITEAAKVLSGGGMRVFGVNRDLVQNGYTQVVVDARGTGFSQGEWQALGPVEQRDSVEIIDWMSKQSWSDGRVGMGGVSYSGINSLQAAGHQPPALKAIFPTEPGNDLLRDIVGTGDGLGVGFMPLWLSLVNGLKFVPDVQALAQGRFDQTWLQDRLRDPLTLFPALIEAMTAPTVNDLDPGTLRVAQDGEFYQERKAQVENIEVPTMLYGAWHDIFANSEPRVYNDIPLPAGEKQLIMSDAYHINFGGGFGEPGAPPRLDVLERAWYDKWLKNADNGIDRYGPVTLYQQGNGWTTTESFPRAGVDYQRMYLSNAPSGTAAHAAIDGSLVADKPADSANLTVAPGLRALCSRDGAQGTAGAAVIFGTACTRDSRFNEAEGLTFTSAPVTRPTELSGPVNLHLETVLDATDGFWAVTLNDVAPDGTSTTLTNGALTASMRAVDDSQSTKSPNGDYTEPHHYLTVATRQPLVPGEVTPVDINFVPTDAVLAPGHRLRVDVYASSIPRYLPLGPMLADSQLKPQHVRLSSDRPSFVNLPLVGATAW